MTRTLTGLFDTYEDAEGAVRDLEQAGVAPEQISIVANRGISDERGAVKEGNEAGAGAGTGAAIGAVVGGAGGVLAGLGMLAIPGVGPVVAAGWLVATAVGAVGGAAVGGAGGGLIGAMIGNGVPEEDAHVYAEGVRRGGSLVTVRIEETMYTTAEAILQRYREVDPVTRGRTYREGGWNRFDETAPHYTPEQIAEEQRQRALPPVW